MTSNSLYLAAIVFYVLTWILITDRVRTEIKLQTNNLKTNRYYFISWLLALILHVVAIHQPLIADMPMNFDFMALASYVMWFISLILFISTFRRKIESLAIAIIPLTILSIISALILSGSAEKVINFRSGLGIHVLVSLIAYSVLMLASFQAILLAAQNNHLHSHQSSGFIRTLPALEDMEHFLFRLITIGVILLSIALISGFYYLDNLFGNNVAHKTILSIISWFIFTALLLGRWKYGWRGKIAIRWTLSGFVVLALAFFGSKYIQEFILQQQDTQTASIENNISPRQLSFFYQKAG